jgi:tRNA(fMet)-specific endonuclease VapC
MINFMLDTDTCIYTIKKKPLHLKRLFNANIGRLCISSVTWGELIYGAEKSSNKASNLDQLEGFATRVDILPFGDNEAKQFGQVRAELEVKGKLIGPYDMMIAGHARSQGLMLITNNIRQYRKVVARYMLKFKY